VQNLRHSPRAAKTRAASSSQYRIKSRETPRRHPFAARGKSIAAASTVRTQCCERGCSLIEALIATTILAMGVASLAQLFTLAVGSNIAATHRTRAAMLAAQKVEELRSLGWEAVVQSAGADAIDAYTRRWRVDRLPANPDNAVTIDVAVTWNQSEVGHLATIRSRRTP
jgi:Tfp pilus assembly protein PilV